jgi:hypothetical protein
VVCKLQYVHEKCSLRMRRWDEIIGKVSDRTKPETVACWVSREHRLLEYPAVMYNSRTRLVSTVGEAAVGYYYLRLFPRSCAVLCYAS